MLAAISQNNLIGNCPSKSFLLTEGENLLPVKAVEITQKINRKF